MNDLAFALMQTKINACAASAKKCLWIVDENIGAGEINKVSPAASLQIISNRSDIYLTLKEYGFNVLLNDFELSSFSAHSFDVIFYRVSKEKAIVHHIINSATRYLKNGGQLVLCGNKNEGIKTYIEKASDLLGERVVLERGGKTSMLAEINFHGSDLLAKKTLLYDNNYAALRAIDVDDVRSFVSKPGQYGWNKIDQGSNFLTRHLPAFFADMKVAPQRIADLGCGYGYLSLMARKVCDAEYIAIDNNVAAVNACKENFKIHAVSGQVILADCADVVTGPIDAVICNPPFHQGFVVESDLILKFLTTSHRLLARNGKALFVVNSFIGVESKAAKLFSNVILVENNKQFKVILLTK